MQMADGDGNPLNARGGIGDHITGLAALAGVLAAVMEQRQTGVGRVVEVSLLRTGTYVLGLGPRHPDGAGQGGRRRAAPPQPGAADEPVPHRRRSLVLLHRARGGPPPAGGVPRARSARPARRPPLRQRRRHPPNRTEVIAILDELVAQRTLDEWAERFDREGVWWAPAQTPAEVVADPQLIANHGFVELEAAGPARRCAR